MKSAAAFAAAVAALAAGLSAAPMAAASIYLPAIVSADPANFTPNVEDDAVVTHTAVYALEQSGTTMYAGGTFHTIDDSTRTTSYIRNNLFSFDATNGTINTFAPVVDGPVWGLAASGDSLYVAGDFTSINGIPREGLAKIDATTGAVDQSFDAHLDGDVTQVRLVDGRLIVGGKFSGKLRALDPATGADTGYIANVIDGKVADNTGRPTVYRFAVNHNETRLVAIGNFLTVDGQVRARAFMLDLGATSTTLDPWYYAPLENLCRSRREAAYLRGVDFAPSGKYFVLVGTGSTPQAGGRGRDVCDSAARFDTAVPAPTSPVWINYTGGDTLHSVAIAGSTVYVQGHNRWLDNPGGRNTCGRSGCVSRPGIGSIDPTTGLATAWNPGKTRAVGGKDLLVTPAGLWIASDGTRTAGEYRRNIAFMPASP